MVFKAANPYIDKRSQAAAWGKCICYVEVAEDQLALRQVNVFENGIRLRYDRSNVSDKNGRLTGLRFSRKPKWRRYFPDAKAISVEEFASVWNG